MKGKPFAVTIPDEVPEDLRERLDNSRRPDPFGAEAGNRVARYYAV